jgi:predicted nucleic acid-binding protein
MRKIYIDTNIFFDIVIDRDLENISIKKLQQYLKESTVYMSALSVHIIYYALKIKPKTQAHERIKELIKIINIVPLSSTITTQAISNFLVDFEDTLQYYSALYSNCDYILTRDRKDFVKIQKSVPSKIKIVTSLRGIK